MRSQGWLMDYTITSLPFGDLSRACFILYEYLRTHVAFNLCATRAMLSGLG